MLKDGDQTAPSCNPMQLSEPHGVLVMRDVVKHARRKHNVEVFPFAREAILFDNKIIAGLRITPFAERKAAFGDVGGCQRSIGKVRSEERNRVAYPGTKIAYPGHADIAALDDLLQLADLIFSEVLGAFSGDGHVVTVLVVVLVGEAIKFDLVHVTIQVRGLFNSLELP
jgi:hypothetical protein